MKLRVLPRAKRDLEDIHAHIMAEDPRAAARTGLAIVQAFELLVRNPNIGRPTHRPATREWAVTGQPYLIPYRVNDEFVEILRVFHTPR